MSYTEHFYTKLFCIKHTTYILLFNHYNCPLGWGLLSLLDKWESIKHGWVICPMSPGQKKWQSQESNQGYLMSDPKFFTPEPVGRFIQQIILNIHIWSITLGKQNPCHEKLHFYRGRWMSKHASRKWVRKKVVSAVNKKKGKGDEECVCGRWASIMYAGHRRPPWYDIWPEPWEKWGNKPYAVWWDVDPDRGKTKYKVLRLDHFGQFWGTPRRTIRLKW